MGAGAGGGLRYLAIALFLLVGCDENSTEQEDNLRDYFAERRFGSSADYMLYRRGDFYTEKHYGVIVLFGFGDNLSVCKELADAWNSKKPNTYYCEKLN